MGPTPQRSSASANPSPSWSPPGTSRMVPSVQEPREAAPDKHPWPEDRARGPRRRGPHSRGGRPERPRALSSSSRRSGDTTLAQDVRRPPESNPQPVRHQYPAPAHTSPLLSLWALTPVWGGHNTPKQRPRARAAPGHEGPTAPRASVSSSTSSILHLLAPFLVVSTGGMWLI